MKKILLSGIMVAVLALSACAPRQETSVTVPSHVPTVDPTPAAVMPLLTMVEYGFRFRYPPEYQAGIYRHQICLTSNEGSMLICHNASAVIEVSDAPDRSLNQIADEVAGKGVPDQVVRTSLTVAGEEAILLDNVLGVDVARVLVILHDDRAFILTFVGWQENQDETSPLGTLYNTIVNSFEFLPQPVIANYEEIEFGISAVIPMTIYSGPAGSHEQVGILEAGAAARVIGRVDGIWLEIICPEGIPRRCWVLWDFNALHSYEGPPVTLEIPDPANLKIESASTFPSPDGRWQALATQSETVTLGVEDARFFYVEFIVTSLEDGRTWTPVSEWHAGGPGSEGPSRPFHWSQDGRYLYYTSVIDYHGGCVYADIGETLDRLDLTDGAVAELPPPQARRNLAISPDETMMAYMSDATLVVRDLPTAYDGGRSVLTSIIWRLDLAVDWPITQASEIVWSPDSRKLLVTATTLVDDLCNKSSATTWELDIETGKLVEVSSTVFPTATP